MTDKDTGEIKAQLDALRRDVDRLLMLVDGDEGLDIDGLRQRMERMEDVAGDVKKFKWTLYGIGIGLGLTGIGSIGTLITVLSRAMGGP
ncbi:MAG: hypothetical protein GTO15_11045 [Pseudomonas stutzeri]|nr:hypothetical protein [Stutzerimonas stutzeri]